MAIPNVKDFQAIYEEIFRDVHNTTDTSVTTFPNLTEVKKIYNDKYQEFVNERQWPWAYRETTVAMVTDQADYTLASDVREVVNMRIETTGRKINFVPRVIFEAKFPKGDVDAPSAAPSMWTPIDPASDNAIKIKLRPVPTSAENGVNITMNYFTTPANLSATTDVPIIPAQWQDIPIYRAKSQIFGVLDDTENEARWGAKAKDLERKAFKELYSQIGWIDEFRDVNDYTQGSGADLNNQLFW